MAVATIATKTISHLYSAKRKALAPSWIIFAMSCIFWLPESHFMIPPYLKKAKKSATTAATAETMSQVLSIRGSFEKGRRKGQG